jgi:hypothetical protein
MFRLQDRTDLIPLVRNRTLTLIEREDDTKSWGNFLVLSLSSRGRMTLRIGAIF